MMKKEYLAVFTGTPVKEKQGIWEDYLIKDGKTNTSRVTGKKDRMAKKAVLSYRIMDWRDDRGLAEKRRDAGSRTGNGHWSVCLAPGICTSKDREKNEI